MPKKIVIGEDDPSLQFAFRTLFETRGIDVDVYDNETELLDNIDCADLLLLDRNLEGGDGLHVCTCLKHNPKYRSLPIVMMSASGDISALSASAGADSFFEKPFDINDVLRKIFLLLGIPFAEPK